MALHFLDIGSKFEILENELFRNKSLEEALAAASLTLPPDALKAINQADLEKGPGRDWFRAFDEKMVGPELKAFSGKKNVNDTDIRLLFVKHAKEILNHYPKGECGSLANLIEAFEGVNKLLEPMRKTYPAYRDLLWHVKNLLKMFKNEIDTLPGDFGPIITLAKKDNKQRPMQDEKTKEFRLATPFLQVTCPAERDFSLLILSYFTRLVLRQDPKGKLMASDDRPASYDVFGFNAAIFFMTNFPKRAEPIFSTLNKSIRVFEQVELVVQKLIEQDRLEHKTDLTAVALRVPSENKEMKRDTTTASATTSASLLKELKVGDTTLGAADPKGVPSQPNTQPDAQPKPPASQSIASKKFLSHPSAEYQSLENLTDDVCRSLDKKELQSLNAMNNCIGNCFDALKNKNPENTQAIQNAYKALHANLKALDQPLNTETKRTSFLQKIHDLLDRHQVYLDQNKRLSSRFT